MASSTTTIIHRVKSVQAERRYYSEEEVGEAFYNLKLSIIDENGGLFEMNLFSDEELEIQQ